MNNSENMVKTRKSSAKSVLRNSGVRIPFFFRKVIRINDEERDYCKRCVKSALRRTRRLQSRGDENQGRDFDMAGGLASYVVFLRHIVEGREIRYSKIFSVVGNMASYMGHDRVLDILEREGVRLNELWWSQCVLSPLASAVVGHQDALACRLLDRFPELVDMPYWHDVVAICVKYGTVRMLRKLYGNGVNLDRRYFTTRKHVKTTRPLGTPFYFAVACDRPDMQKELLRLGTFPSTGDGAPNTWLWGEGKTLFEVAVEKRNYNVADMCIEKGLGPLFDGEGDVYVLNRSGANEDFEKLKYFESRFKDMNFSEIVKESLSGCGCKEWFSRDVLLHCGIEPDEPEADTDGTRVFDPECVPDDISVFFSKLEFWPELIVPWYERKPHLVKLMFSARGLNIFQEYASSFVPVFRFAKLHGFELFGHWEQQREFMELLSWYERRHLAPHVSEFGFPTLKLITEWEYDKHPDYVGDYWDKRQWKAASAKGKNAERYLDNEHFVQKYYVSNVATFAGFVSEHADWELYEKWIMRGMSPYNVNEEYFYDYPLINCVNANILRHLVKDLGMFGDLKGKTGAWALSRVIERHELDLVRCLLDLGVPVNVSVEGYASALRKSILVGADEISAFLLRKGGRNIDPYGREFPIPPWILNHDDIASREIWK